jgi:hypothetical protein
MKLFKCPHCGQLIYFENTRCESCGHRLGYIPDDDVLTALEPDEGRRWRSLAEGGGLYRFCDNAEHDACNWLVPAESPRSLCRACRHNRMIPNIDEPAALASWQKIEIAKRRLFYSLLQLDLPTPAQGEAKEPLIFDFLADAPRADGPKVMTGHDDGLITIALAEADDAERERRRTRMGEPYRTLIGHFRHEVGHFYWDVLVRDGGRLEECRAVFGNDELDYSEALKHHYAVGAPANWQENYISAYATTHPWEDFAETWAHYLHIVDSLEMARAFGMGVRPRVDQSGWLAAEAKRDPYETESVATLVDTWIPLAFALNSINRCMGQSDLYPFILSPPVIEKLGFIHRLVHRIGADTATGKALQDA